ncbi:hypothetical protein CC80DRAFT_537261 [Byssothecium circinans]|uniref:Uncharacterized protein n=1 Tax=Byssothecium circinans TaxID=147558 RepID=A0A6A5TMD7_9PLEO|nr:hypothetical protein CC80DRAFT_537261 [Byssothecium circinans]
MSSNNNNNGNTNRQGFGNPANNQFDQQGGNNASNPQPDLPLSATGNPFDPNSGIDFGGFEHPAETVARGNAAHQHFGRGGSPDEGVAIPIYPPDHPSHPNNLPFGRGGWRGRGDRGGRGRGGQRGRGGSTSAGFAGLGWRTQNRPTERTNVDNSAVERAVDALRKGLDPGSRNENGSVTVTRQWARQVLGQDNFVRAQPGGPWVLSKNQPFFKDSVSFGMNKPMLDWLAGLNTEATDTFTMAADRARMFFR